MVISLRGKRLSTRLYSHLDTRPFETVALSRAVLPYAYFNISDKIKNNIVRYMTGEKEGAHYKVFRVTIRNGLYSVQSFNEELQRVIARNGHQRGYINISYVEARGRVNLTIKKPYTLYVDTHLGDLLGMGEGRYGDGADIDTRGIMPCQFTPHTEYHITCNPVDKTKNLFNGEPSDIIATLQPHVGQYGDSFSYAYGVKMPITHDGFSEIVLKVYNQAMEEIVFQEAVQIILILE